MLIAALLASLALQQASSTAPDRDCLDDNMIDRCRAEQQEKVRAMFGVAAIEEEAAAGAEIYRAFFVDGYGRDMPVVAFERRRGQAPQAVIYGAGGGRISAPVSAGAWARVRNEAVLADRKLEPLPAQGDELNICLHSWVQTVEMANSTPGGRRTEPVRRRVEDACGGGLTTRFAFQLADMAVEAIHPCDVLDINQQRNRITQLAACLSLEGDRLAAAELRNARSTFGPRWGLNPKDAGAWRAAIGTNGSPVLDWAGSVVRTERGRDNEVAEFIVGKLNELPNLRFEQRQFEGVSGREGVVRGQATYGGDGAGYVASYRQVWLWDPNLSEWMLSEWTVEPFRPMS